MNPTSTRDIKPFYTLVGQAFTLVKKHVHALALISIIPLVFVGASQAALSAFDPGASLGMVLTFSIIGVLFMVCGFFFRVMYPITVVRAIDSVNQSVDSASPAIIDPVSFYRKSFSDFWAYLVIVILLGLTLVAGSLFLIIPGVVVFMYFGFSAFTYVFEGKRGLNALVASAWLVRGRLYEVFQRMFPAALLTLLSALIIVLIVGLILGVAGFDQSVAQFVSSIFIAMFVMPFLYSFGYFLYRDLALGVGSEIDPHFAKTAKIWIVTLSILGGLFIVVIPVVLVILVMVGKLIVT